MSQSPIVVNGRTTTLDDLRAFTANPCWALFLINQDAQIAACDAIRNSSDCPHGKERFHTGQISTCQTVKQFPVELEKTIRSYT